MTAMSAFDWTLACLVSATAYAVLSLAGRWIFELGYRSR
jgi:hypothetical protein